MLTKPHIPPGSRQGHSAFDSPSPPASSFLIAQNVGQAQPKAANIFTPFPHSLSLCKIATGKKLIQSFLPAEGRET